RRRLLTPIREQASRLRPGLYIGVSDRLWRHWRTSVPAHLLRTKGSGSDARPIPLRKRVTTLSIFWNGWRGNGIYSLAVPAYDGGVVLLAPELRRVAHADGDRRIGHTYIELRR